MSIAVEGEVKQFRAHRLIRVASQWTYLFRLLVVLLPWHVRRIALIKIWKFDIHPTSRIGLAWVFPNHLVMGAHATIGHFTVCKGLERLCLEEHALIGRLNWITGHPKTGKAYRQVANRRSELILCRHAAVTNRHLLDCTDAIHIGEFATIAGYWSQLLTHSIDLRASRQASRPIKIGDYCFTGTGCVILGGSALPSFSVLGAGSLLNKELTETYTLYGGTPARPIKPLSRNYGYFCREEGFVL